MRRASHAKAAMFVVIGALVGAGLSGSALAESFKDKGGRATYAPASVEDTKYPDGSIVRRMSSTGMAIADLPFPFDYVKHQCSGTALIAADGKSGRTRGLCEMQSTKGDRAAFVYVGDFTGGRWMYIEGTGIGAYAGIKGEGTYKVKAVMPGGGAFNEWTGTWQTD